MSSVHIIVSLKAPDPAAITALTTLERISPDICPGRLLRYDHWSFSGEGADQIAVREIVSHFTDIVNPNKQTWSFFNGLGGMELGSEMAWTGVLVTDTVDSVSENWSRIVSVRNPKLESVDYSVLWLLGFRSGLDSSEYLARTREIAETRFRDHGLLANPVSQRVRILDPCLV